jgi:hypothetical protein
MKMGQDYAARESVTTRSLGTRKSRLFASSRTEHLRREIHSHERAYIISDR